MKQNRPLSSLLAATLALPLFLGAGTAQAEDVAPKGKGIAGGALLGGEVVMGVEAAFGVKPAWAYLLGGALGAGAGAYGGYVIEREASPKVSLYMLAGGMALIIPTTVAVLQATSFKPSVEYTEDNPTVPYPAAEPPRPTLQAPSGLLDVDEGSLRLSVPAIEVRPVFTKAELSQYGFIQRDQLHIPMLSGSF